MEAHEIKEKDNVLVITDTEKIDGIIALFCLTKFLKTQKITILDVDDFASGKKNFPKVSQSKLIIIGCDFEKQSLIELKALCQGIVVIDNRFERREPLAGLKFAYIRTNRTLARVVWDYFRGDRAPWIIDYTEDMRQWKWIKLNPIFMKAALDTYKKDKETLDLLALRDPVDVEREGREIKESEQTKKGETKNEETGSTEGKREAGPKKKRPGSTTE